MEENRLQSVKKALQNPLILQNIFRKLDSSDLLDCRLVSILNWFDLATEVICEKKQLKIDFDFSSWLSSGKYCRSFQNASQNPWSLKSLSSVIQNSSKGFPCFRFRFVQGFLDEPALLEFFSVYGNSIIDLEIDVIARKNVNNAIEQFGEILLNQLPNLEKLTIWKVSLGWSSSTRLFPKEIRATAILPKLKFLKFEKSLGRPEFKFLQDIQNAAPNLEVSNVQKIPFVHPETKKTENFIWGTGIYPSLMFAPQKSNFGFYERVLRTRGKFSKIVINLENLEQRPEILSRATELLTDILDLSQRTLIQLVGVVELASLTGIKLNPLQFPRVENLHLQTLTKNCPGKKQQEKEGGDNFSSSTLNPESKSLCNISQSFPCLFEINLESLDFIQLCQDSIQTVRKLKSETFFGGGESFQKLATVFPMLENLELNNIKNFKDCADSLWANFGKLTKLQLGILLDDSVQNDVSMDKYFVGTEKTSSFLQLQELKTLHLTITPIPEKPASGSAILDLENGKWSRWNFLGKSMKTLVVQNMEQLQGIDLIVDARKTSCRDPKEIRNQLRGLRPFFTIQIQANRKFDKNKCLQRLQNKQICTRKQN